MMIFTPEVFDFRGVFLHCFGVILLSVPCAVMVSAIV